MFSLLTRMKQPKGTNMKKLAISLLAGAAALVAGSAQAAPLSPMTPTLDNGIENVRMVCDESGRCWRERGQRRVIIQRDSYNYYEPSYVQRRQGYYDQGHYDQGYHNQGPGVQFNAPGVSFGFGGGQRW